MAANKKYRLFWIRVLMTISLGMLLLVALSWLFAQHSTQKARLTKDLNTALSTAQSSVSDSMVMVLTSKMLADSSIDLNFDKSHSFAGPNLPGSSMSVSIQTDDSDADFSKVIKHKVLRAEKPSDTSFVAMKLKADKKEEFVFNSKNGDDVEKIVKPILNVLFKNVINTEEIAKGFEIVFDSASIQAAFREELKNHGWDFTTAWDNVKSNQQDQIILTNSYFGKSYTVAIGNYSTYLLKSIIPQVLFIIFLLGITAGAFLFTYNTLREQIRLGIIKNEFISNMSHELKTPVSTVKVALEAINNFHPITDNKTTRDYLEMASLETERLEMLINQSLNISLIEQGRVVLEKESCDLQQLLEKTTHAMQVRFKQNNADIHINIAAANTNVKIDALHIQGVLINLLDNSLKYNNTIPVININLREGEKSLILSISDNGPGIPGEYIDKIFDKFFRVPQGDLHNVKGYGLGLSYVKQVVEQHNGTISVDNLDTGCMFTITLPKSLT